MSNEFESRAKTVNRDLLILTLAGALVLGFSALLTPLFGLPRDSLGRVDFLAEAIVYGLPALVFDWPIDREDIAERRSARVLAVVLSVVTLAVLALTRSHELEDDAVCVLALVGWKCFQVWFDREELSEWP